MEKRSKEKATFKQEPGELHSEINPGTSSQKLKTDNNYEEAEKKLNSKILKIAVKINDHYPELSKYLEEMPVTVPVDKKTGNNIAEFKRILRIVECVVE